MYHKTLISCTDFCLTFVLADGVLIQGQTLIEEDVFP